MNKIEIVEFADPGRIARELEYVGSSRGLRRVWRCLRAAWRCSRIAARAKRAGRPQET